MGTSILESKIVMERTIVCINIKILNNIPVTYIPRYERFAKNVLIKYSADKTSPIIEAAK